MDGNIVEATQIIGAVAANDFSVWALFLKADIIVKAVMVFLFIASIWCWAIIVEKMLRLRKLNSSAEEFESSFWSGGSLDALHDRIGAHPADPMSAVFSAAMREWRRSVDGGGVRDSSSGLMERIDRVMHVTVSREIERIERQMTILASTGSTAPFVGLFGTVWGIMNSFQSIAIAQNTNLSVVAPGIAEALFATALGLFVAIPAVVSYNKVTSDLSKYFVSLETFMDEYITIFFRQLENK